ncbi:molybdenum cofactor guanylyltransferase [Teredinibacter sp. KSP-S5-2]|uniref:molybdenum cofactor guanylyltransferase n=1 Tax=Teredinibacter sp. KSP-S5-2 TaxID=3034506 RepID=UPI002935284B|nr:molybdenum cofactor guanylyltransferase [Teredinibacter sp. KSP-S5-2]WNO11528.1 molybdenum cofactor guanylyltransferase [Teredinibacter sp. KSP-S5-2]
MAQKNNPVFHGLVLAGGESRRMGKDKALLTIQGKSWLEYSCDRLVQSGCEHVYVSRNQGDGIADLIPNKGPVGGVYSVLHYICEHEIELDWLTVIPVDMPLLTVDAIRHLHQTVEQTGKSAFYSDSLFPFSIRVNTDLREKTSLAVNGDKTNSIRYLLKQCGAAEIASTTNMQLTNVNTPEEWSRVAHNNFI